MFSLVSDRLGGQVTAQKDAGTLGKVRKSIKKKKKKMGEIANTSFCIVDLIF